MFLRFGNGYDNPMAVKSQPFVGSIVLAITLSVGVANAQAPPPTPQSVVSPTFGMAAQPSTNFEPWASRHRSAIAYSSLGAVYASFTVWSYFAWYRQAYLPSFTVGGDGLFGANTYAGGADKMGHLWANLALSRGGAELLTWAGWKPLPASLLSAGLSFALFTAVEVKDGFHYQFSYGDLAGDGIGAALGALQVNFPRFDELFDFRVEFFPSKRYRKKFLAGDVNVAEDYSGQTYLTALHLGAFSSLRSNRYTSWSRFVDVAIGFQTRGYKPDPEPGETDTTKQQLFVGLSLNAQGLFDWAFADTGCRGHTARTMLHGTFEMINLPYSSLPLYKLDR
jgi:hypothetical protein